MITVVSTRIRGGASVHKHKEVCPCVVPNPRELFWNYSNASGCKPTCVAERPSGDVHSEPASSCTSPTAKTPAGSLKSPVARFVRSQGYASGSTNAGLKPFTTFPAPGGRRRFPPLAKARIVELACLEPSAIGLHLTQWSVRTLTDVVIERGILSSVHYSTLSQILASVTLQPHRKKYWKTTRLDESFKNRAEQILWCYEQVERLAAEGYLVVCVDEKPNIQVLERTCPSRCPRPGSVRRVEFEYVRHGTVNMLFYLYVHSGRMVGHCLPRNDADHYIASLECFRQAHRDVQGVYLIQDNGSSHIAAATRAYFADDAQWWRPRYTPPHASWLNQGEILIGAFSKRYLGDGSWPDPQAMIEHLDASWHEYNDRYAHPFTWTWSRSKMRQWYHEHAHPN